jgi:hypothetical protein
MIQSKTTMLQKEKMSMEVHVNLENKGSFGLSSGLF